MKEVNLKYSIFMKLFSINSDNLIFSQEKCFVVGVKLSLKL